MLGSRNNGKNTRHESHPDVPTGLPDSDYWDFALAAFPSTLASLSREFLANSSGLLQ